MPLGLRTSRLAFILPACILASLSTSADGQIIGSGSRIPAIFISPHSGASTDTTVVYVETPQHVAWQGATVQLVFPPEVCDLLVLCGFDFTDCPRTFQQTTDGQGKARFMIQGGGCWGSGKRNGLTWVNDTFPEGYLVRVLVNNQVVALRGVRSGDVVDGSYKLATQLWCEAPPANLGATQISLSDAVFFTTPFKTSPAFGSSTWVACADLDGSGAIDLTDLVMATPPLKHASQGCSENSH